MSCGKNEKRNTSESKSKLEDDIDALFALPLAEFTSARNALAARLKQSGRADEAHRVKALSKPPVSAWAVNQLYRRHRKEFDRLIAAGQRFRQAQASQIAGKASDIRGPLDARREALLELSHLAAAVLRDADHNPTPDTMRRIATTLEAMSAYGSLPDTSRPGYLTADLDPPGFESLAALTPGAATSDRMQRPAISDVKLEDTSQASIAAAKISLQNAERVLGEARIRAQGAETALKRANADVNEAEKREREAEDRFKKAKDASEEAGQRARRLAAEALEAKTAVEHAARNLEKASGELLSLLEK